MIGRVVRLGRGVARFVAKEVRERIDGARPTADQPANPERSNFESTQSDPVEVVDVKDLRAALDTDDAPVLLDCREEHEWEAGYIDGCVHIPMNDLPDRRAELDPGRRTIVYCLHGIRSAEVAAWLRDTCAFADVASMDGGIVSWYAEFKQERIVVTRSEDH